MLFGIMGCNGDGGDGGTGGTGGDGGTGGTGTTPASTGGDGTRHITIGTWFDVYYMSPHSDPFDNPRVANPELAQIQIDNMRAIEAKYNITLEYVNLTWNGIQESIATSIMAGMPDCDVYIVDLQFGIPTVLSNLAISLESMGLAGTDVFETIPHAMKSVNLGQPETYLFASAQATSLDTYAMAFNLDMIREKNLENPQDLWDRGEWTWDVWRQYLIALTDYDRGIYGWSGYWTNALENLIFSNGTTIAGGAQTTITSPATLEVFDLFYTIYNIERTARPWDETEWTINNKLYAEGRSGFWVFADWMAPEFGGAELPFEIGIVPWPVGPSGNKDTNAHGSVGGNWYMIPKGVDNARLVYDVMYDWVNWRDYDRELVEELMEEDDLEWSMNQYMTTRNFEYALMMHNNTGFDIWNNLGLGDDFSMMEIMRGEETASQWAEARRPLVQDALDNFFN
jgi:hypothetical protein